MDRLTKEEFNDVEILTRIINNEVFHGDTIVNPYCISTCPPTIRETVLKAYRTTDPDPIVMQIYLSAEKMMYVIIQELDVGVSLSIIKKEYIDEFYN